MITKELIKNEVDKVQEEYLEALYRIIRALESDDTSESVRRETSANDRNDWREFIAETYGCLADDPIERGDQGKFETRLAIE